MIKALIIPMSWGRGSGPMLEAVSIARALRKRDVSVAMATKRKFEQLRDTELAIEYFEMPSRPLAPVDEMFVKDFAVFQGLGDSEYLQKILDAEKQAVCSFEPDVVISNLQPTAAVTSAAFGIPLLSEARWTEHPRFESEVYEQFFDSQKSPPSRATSAMNVQLLQRGLHPVRDVWDLCFMRSDRSFIPSIEEFEPELANLPGAEYVGYLVPATTYSSKTLNSIVVNWIKRSKNPVLVYFSNKWLHPDDYLGVLKEVELSSEYEFLVIDREFTNFQELGASLLGPWVAVDQILDELSAIVSLGTRTLGFQAIMASKGNVIFRGQDDELVFTGDAFEKLGCAVCVEPKQISAGRLKAALDAVNGEKIRARCREVRNKILKLGGPDRVAEIAIEMCQA